MTKNKDVKKEVYIVGIVDYINQGEHIIVQSAINVFWRWTIIVPG